MAADNEVLVQVETTYNITDEDGDVYAVYEDEGYLFLEFDGDEENAIPMTAAGARAIGIALCAAADAMEMEEDE